MVANDDAPPLAAESESAPEPKPKPEPGNEPIQGVPPQRGRGRACRMRSSAEAASSEGPRSSVRSTSTTEQSRRFAARLSPPPLRASARGPSHGKAPSLPSWG
jgi:hypothetical protein